MRLVGCAPIMTIEPHFPGSFSDCSVPSVSALTMTYDLTALAIEFDWHVKESIISDSGMCENGRGEAASWLPTSPPPPFPLYPRSNGSGSSVIRC